MGRLRGGEHTVRNASLVGAGLLVGGVAVGLGVREWCRTHNHPSLQLIWDTDEHPAFPMETKWQAVDLGPYGSKAYRKHAALLTTDARPFNEQLSRSEGSAAIAAKGVDGLWYAGVVPNGKEFGTMSVGELGQRAVAVPLGGLALDEVQMGIMDEGLFVPFDTNLQEVSTRRDIMAAHPDIPMVTELQFASSTAVHPTSS